MWNHSMWNVFIYLYYWFPFNGDLAYKKSLVIGFVRILGLYWQQMLHSPGDNAKMVWQVFIRLWNLITQPLIPKAPCVPIVSVVLSPIVECVYFIFDSIELVLVSSGCFPLWKIVVWVFNRIMTWFQIWSSSCLTCCLVGYWHLFPTRSPKLQVIHYCL